ncbi:nucleolar protein 12-like isoform X1 [Pollicipes pollicipes]|uniref:nucleolar protein 12-like isoform X1 n=2 Tax=Pollicipes pollicipes TaxID=41117 RepID=UPI001884BE8E|nr:nucleolar protein 12-like isoform X1 [Pollicipes pollicipes]
MDGYILYCDNMGRKQGTAKVKTKGPKLELVFNENDRRNYLTGFKKRKQERRETAMKKFDTRFKQEKNRIRQEKRNNRVSHGPTVLPDNMLISEEPEAVTHELDRHTVSVSTIRHIDLNAGGLFPGGQLTAEPEEEEEQDEEQKEQEDQVPGMELKASVAAQPPEKAVSQRSRQKILQAKAKLQEKKNRKKSQCLQKHKARVRKKHMKLSNQLKRQKRKGTA